MLYIRAAFIVVRCIATGVAFYATAKHPHGFYLLTRWIVFLTCCWGIVLCRQRFWPSAAPAYALLTLVFNPLLPFHFTHGTWHNLDISAGLILSASLLGPQLPALQTTKAP